MDVVAKGWGTDGQWVADAGYLDWILCCSAEALGALITINNADFEENAEVASCAWTLSPLPQALPQLTAGFACRRVQAPERLGRLRRRHRRRQVPALGTERSVGRGQRVGPGRGERRLLHVHPCAFLPSSRRLSRL